MVPNGALSYKLTWKIRTPLVGPKVSIIHRFHCMYACMYACMYVYMYVSMCMYMYTYVCMY